MGVARPENRGDDIHRPTITRAKNQKWQKAVAVVKRIEELELLLTVSRIVSCVQIQHDSLGRVMEMTLHEDLQQLHAQAVQTRGSNRVFKPGKRRLARRARA